MVDLNIEKYEIQEEDNMIKKQVDELITRVEENDNTNKEIKNEVNEIEKKIESLINRDEKVKTYCEKATILFENFIKLLNEQNEIIKLQGDTIKSLENEMKINVLPFIHNQKNLNDENKNEQNIIKKQIDEEISKLNLENKNISSNLISIEQQLKQNKNINDNQQKQLQNVELKINEESENNTKNLLSLKEEYKQYKNWNTEYLNNQLNEINLQLSKFNNKMNFFVEKHEVENINNIICLLEKTIKKKDKQNLSLVSIAISNVETQLNSLKGSFEKFIVNSNSKEKKVNHLISSIPSMWKCLYKQKFEKIRLDCYFDDLCQWTKLNAINHIEIITMERLQFSSLFVQSVKGCSNVMFIFRTIDQHIFGCFNKLIIPFEFTKPGDVDTGIGFDDNHFIFTCNHETHKLILWKMKREAETLELFKENSEDLIKVEKAFSIKKNGEGYFSTKMNEYYTNINKITIDKNDRFKVECFYIVYWE
ncbi:hypothetical protein EHI_170620 [Entamoeba histolytica HM-1:IMSS]|uniref:TLDc domain-containing protein n=4 Tax=Entamoeba histolytica TaxID=5759 RepID=C4M6V5_ENTH1|nr:hypothetical protein EHI_170620 [Entamoeba histolytica HM-1:IMSS]EAL43015.1 hypothetical protein EHI_170620 [Entamoeba histolytica HM-1:IMSS]EMD43011.1 Hypothetical protein EHI5A_117380 [Entamoeba histolytica KU27]ENY61417.1 hypothetical protein EHI7A_070960 [Entamoeba histolytica HM-1:IMSS-A]|eukprot:XP_648402.1 hypothetical protein EHI_170620 [Entamoeba histolytica HM-1:IMSS]